MSVSAPSPAQSALREPTSHEPAPHEPAPHEPAPHEPARGEPYAIAAPDTTDGSGENLRLPVPIIARLDADALYRRPLAVVVISLSPEGGEFTTEDGGAAMPGVLVPGTAVTLHLFVPWTREVTLRARLTSAHAESGHERIVFRLLDRASSRGSALILAGTVDGFDFTAARAAGVPASTLRRHLTIRTVTDDAGFRQALRLRLQANRAFGRLPGVDDVATVADHLDPYAITFLCMVGDKAIGTGRVVVNGGDRRLSEDETETGGLPSWVWADGCIESSRIAVRDGYRGSGVIVTVFQEVARLAFSLGHRYIVMDAIGKLVPLYERIGARRIGLTKTHPYSDETVHVMVVDLRRMLTRLDRRWPYWQYAFGAVLAHHVRTAPPDSLRRITAGRGRRTLAFNRAVSRLMARLGER